MAGRVYDQQLFPGLRPDIYERVDVAFRHIYRIAGSGLQTHPVHQELKRAAVYDVDLVLPGVNVCGGGRPRVAAFMGGGP